MKLPGKYIEFSDALEKAQGELKPVRIVEYGVFILILLPEDRWTFVKMEGFVHLSGYVGGYNSLAPEIARGLVKLGLWDNKQAGKFVSWYSGEKEKIGKKVAIAQAKVLLKESGFTVKDPE